MASQLPQPRHRWFAWFYDRLIEPSDKKTMGPLRQFAAGGARGRVLELGAGVGSNLAYYDWAQVDALELTEPDPFMAQRIAPRLDALPPEARDKVRLQTVPAEALPFADAEFDCAVVTLVLCSVADPVVSLAELRRVLKPGGELRLVEHVKGGGKTATAQRLVQPVYGHLSGGCQLSRDTELLIRATGFDLHVTQRTALGPLWPAFVGTARIRSQP